MNIDDILWTITPISGGLIVSGKYSGVELSSRLTHGVVDIIQQQCDGDPVGEIKNGIYKELLRLKGISEIPTEMDLSSST